MKGRLIYWEYPKLAHGKPVRKKERRYSRETQRRGAKRMVSHSSRIWMKRYKNVKVATNKLR
jgi:hypothetical protein